MTLGRAIRVGGAVALLVLVVLVAPPATVFAERINQSPQSLALEAYRNFAMRQGAGDRMIFPYLECSRDQPTAPMPTKAELESARHGQWSAPVGNMIVEDAFIAADTLDETAGYARLLAEHYSHAELAALVACQEASLIASRCREQVRAVTWGQNDKLEAERDPISSDALRAKSYCLYYPAVTAYLRQSAEGSKNDH